MDTAGAVAERKRRYRKKRKLAGLCAHDGCQVKPRGRYHCDAHAAEYAAWKKSRRHALKAAA